MKAIFLFVFLIFLNCKFLFSQKDIIVYYSSGELHFKGRICNGDKCGTWYEFDKSGDTINRLEFSGKYKCEIFPIKNDPEIEEYYFGFFRDSLVRSGRFYRKDEKTKEVKEGIYNKDKLRVLTRYYDLGVIDDTSGFNNKREEESNMMFDDGQNIRILEHKRNGKLHGLRIVFDDNNTINEIGNYYDGARIGDWFFYEHGMLVCKGSYYPDYLTNVVTSGKLKIINKDSVPAENIYSKSTIDSYDFLTIEKFFIKDGTWLYYSSKGILTKEELYDKGEIIRTIIY